MFFVKKQKNPQMFFVKKQKNPQMFLAKYQKNPQMFRFNYKTKCTTIKSVYKSDSGWVKGQTLLVAYDDSELFDAINSFGLDAVDDFEIGESRQQNRIKVHGIWYNNYGDVIND